MIVWIASYPRSGNTLVRLLLKQCFGIGTYSLYDDAADIGADPAVAELVGHSAHGKSAEEFVAEARAAPEPLFIKTHEKPDDDSKAIYIVRDGRAAIASYFHYLQDIAAANTLLEDVVWGEVWGGSWSEHVDAWVFSKRPNTLLLRFEDLAANPSPALRLIGDFLALPIRDEAPVEFSTLHGLAPAFFRTGSNESNISELEAECASQFWMLHGQAMLRLNYVRSVPKFRPI